MHRYTAEGKDQQTDDIVQGNENHDAVCHLPEPLFGTQAQVEQQDGRFDQPDSDNEDVLGRQIILQLLVAARYVWDAPVKRTCLKGLILLRYKSQMWTPYPFLMSAHISNAITVHLSLDTY